MVAQRKNSTSFDKDAFLKKNENLKLREKLATIEKAQPGFWCRLEKIRDNYIRSMGTYKSTVSEIINEISQSDMSAPTIHSIRYRVKDVDSLLIKIIDKVSQVPASVQGNAEIEKYRDISEDNYFKIVTDLVGIRILIRYRHQWNTVHNLIWNLYHDENQEYVTDWVKQFSEDRSRKFIAEQPKAYIKQERDRVTYESIGKNVFQIFPSDDHYASLHYIINFAGRYVELQVRTIFDEAWCECSHDFVYKTSVKSEKSKKELERLSMILAQQTTAAEAIVSLMCDIAKPQKNRSKVVSETATNKEKKDARAKTYLAIMERATLLSRSQEKRQRKEQ